MKKILSWIHNLNHDYDKLDGAQRDHVIILLAILVLVVSVLLPMIISIAHQVNFRNVAVPTFLIVISILRGVRFAYKKGNLDKYDYVKINKM